MKGEAQQKFQEKLADCRVEMLLQRLHEST